MAGVYERRLYLKKFKVLQTAPCVQNQIFMALFQTGLKKIK